MGEGRGGRYPAAPIATARQPASHLAQRSGQRAATSQEAPQWQAAAMIALLFSGFLPRVGVRFNWVEFHWIAGLVLTASILFHIVHATLGMDFWAIWPDKTDVQDSIQRIKKFFGKPATVDKWTFSTNGVAIAGIHGIPCFGLGPGNEVYAHAPNECCPVEHLSGAAAFYAGLVAELNGKV